MQLEQGLESGLGLASLLQQFGVFEQGARHLWRQAARLLEQVRGLLELARAHAGLGLFAQVVGLPGPEAAVAVGVQARGHLTGLRPVTRALVDGQQGQPRLLLVGRALEPLQGGLGPVEQAGLEKVQRQRVLCAVALALLEVAPGEQVFMHPHSTIVFSAPAKQIAQREVQLRGVGIVLYRLDEGVDGLVLLLVEQEVQTAKIGLGRLPVFDPHLPEVQARGQPA